MPPTRPPALLLGACWEAPLVGVPQLAGRTGEEPGEFQELPHPHQTSLAASGPCTTSRASQTGSAVAWSRAPAFGRACCMPAWMLLHLCRVAALLVLRLTSGLLPCTGHQWCEHCTEGLLSLLVPSHFKSCFACFTHL